MNSWPLQMRPQIRLRRLREPRLQDTLCSMANAAEEIGHAWSGSNIGCHATVYCRGLEPRPAHVQFSPEWGLADRWPTHQPNGVWEIFDHQAVVDETLRRAGAPDINGMEAALTSLRDVFLRLRESVISVLTAVLGLSDDKFIQRKLGQAEQLQAPDVTTLVKYGLPRRAWSRDSLAITQGSPGGSAPMRSSHPQCCARP